MRVGKKVITVRKVIVYAKYKFYRLLFNLSGFVILLCLYVLKPFKTVKICIIRHERLGHLASNTDLFLRQIQLRKRGGEDSTFYIGISSTKPANQQLLTMWKRTFPVIQSDFASNIAHSSPLMRRGYSMHLPGTRNPSYDRHPYYEFNNTEPNLQFTASEEVKGQELLNNIGIDDSSWFICFHSRDHVYLDNQWQQLYDQPIDWSYHDYRDCDIKNYLKAAKYIASLGGFALRMGSGVAEKLPDLGNPRIIDYASYYRTDFGDIYLAAKCKYFLGVQSGIDFVPTLFHTPVALVNIIPLNWDPYRKGDLYIPKKLWCIDEKRFLTFSEILESQVWRFQRSDQYRNAGLQVIENTAEEILDLAVEINERIDEKFEYSEEDEELQNKFRSLFQPHRLGYGSPARVGAKFLRQNRELLD